MTWTEVDGGVAAASGTLTPYAPVFNVKSLPYGAVGDDTTDDTTAIQSACTAASAAGGGIVLLPTGMYKTTSTILVPKGVVLQGVYNYGRNVTYTAPCVIHGVHTGAAIVSLKGAQGCSVRDLELYGDATTSPKTGLLLGRSSASSAGKHFLQNVLVDGYFSKAAGYSIASEENVWNNCTFILNGGGALYAFYTSQGDGLSVDTLTGSSNTYVTYTGCEWLNYVNDASAAAIYMDVGSSTREHNFFGGYIIPKAGSYVQITVAVDGATCNGPIGFYGVSGELTAGGLGPTTGFSLTSTGALSLRGLTIIGARMDTSTAILAMDANIRLTQAFICLPQNTHGATLVAANISDSYIVDGTNSGWTAFTPSFSTDSGAVSVGTAVATVRVVNRTMSIRLTYLSATITATPTRVSFTVPFSKTVTALNSPVGSLTYINNGGANSPGYAAALVNGTRIDMFRDVNATAYAAGATNNHFVLAIDFEIQ